MSILGEASFQKSLVVSLSLHRAMKTRKNYAVFLLFYAKLNSLKFKCLVYREVFQRVLFSFFVRQEFWLEKSKGGICMALSSKALVITGIDDRRYWVNMPTTESR